MNVFCVSPLSECPRFLSGDKQPQSVSLPISRGRRRPPRYRRCSTWCSPTRGPCIGGGAFLEAGGIRPILPGGGGRCPDHLLAVNYPVAYKPRDRPYHRLPIIYPGLMATGLFSPTAPPPAAGLSPNGLLSQALGGSSGGTGPTPPWTPPPSPAAATTSMASRSVAGQWVQADTLRERGGRVPLYCHSMCL